MQDYEQTYEEFWKRLVENEDGTLNKDAVMRELHDFHFMIEEVPKVYEVVTGGMLSKPNYHARGVIQAFEEYVERLVDEAFEDAGY